MEALTPSQQLATKGASGSFFCVSDNAGARNRRSESGDDESDDVELHLPIKNVI